MNFEHQAVIPEFIITLRHLLRTEAADWNNPLYSYVQGTRMRTIILRTVVLLMVNMGRSICFGFVPTS